MAEDQTADVGGEPTFVHQPGGSGPLGIREAARSLTDARNKQNASPAPEVIEKPVSQPQAAQEAPAADESADEADANPNEGHGETPEVEAPEIEPIEPPVSWTTAEKERWQSIPRETQEYIAQRETEREKLLHQKSKEAEDQLKGMTAREQAMEQARLQFESATQAALQSLQSTLQGEFADIQNTDDMKRLANEDWARYLRWDAHQKDIAAKMAIVREAQERQANEVQTKFAKFAEEQDKAFIARVPEFANKDKAAELQSAAIKTLKAIGFTDDELGKHWNKQDSLTLRDARMQELIHKAARWDAAQEAKKTVSAKKDLPPVQRPGVTEPKAGKASQIQSLQKQLNGATGMQALRLATQLTRLQRDAGSR